MSEIVNEVSSAEVNSLQEDVLADIRRFEPLWGEWHFLEIMGRGPSATVYRAAAAQPDGSRRTAAVKHIHDPEGTLVGQITERFELMKSLSWHPNIIRYEDIAVVPEGGDPPACDIFIRMEEMRGLNVLVREEGLNESSILRLGTQICSALTAISEAGAVHREIKPANILVDDGGSGKLGDIAIPQLLYSEDSFADAESYMAPEVYRREECDIRADIYSLGLVIYQLLNSNRLPFEPTSGMVNLEHQRAAIDERMAGHEIPNINGIIDEANNVLLKACAFDPAKRYQTPAEFSAALDELLEMDSIIHLSTVSTPEEAARLQEAMLERYEFMTYGEVFDYGSASSRKAARKRAKEVTRRPEPRKKHAPLWVIVIPVMILAAALVGCYWLGLFNTDRMIAEDYLTIQTISRENSTVLSCRDGIEEIVIPGEYEKCKVTAIGSEAFTPCRTIETVYMPVSITTIEPSAFAKCRNLKRITVPENVRMISRKTFYGCTALERVDLPAGVTSIGEKAFYKCASLKSVTLPSVTTIGTDAFYGCPEDLVIIGTPGSYVEEYCQRHAITFEPIE